MEWYVLGVESGIVLFHLNCPLLSLASERIAFVGRLDWRYSLNSKREGKSRTNMQKKANRSSQTPSLLEEEGSGLCCHCRPTFGIRNTQEIDNRFIPGPPLLLISLTCIWPSVERCSKLSLRKYLLFILRTINLPQLKWIPPALLGI